MREAVEVWNQAATNGGAVDVNLTVETFHTLLILFIVGTGASGFVTADVLTVNGSNYTYKTVATLPVGSDASFSIGREVGVGVIPVPRAVHVHCVAGAGAATITLLIIGIRDVPV